VADQRTEQRGSKPRNAADAKPGDVIETNIPARMDRLPWSRWHWLVVIALGITWVLDGLEVTIVGAIGPVLGLNQTLSLDPGQIGLVGSLYVAGTVVGAREHRRSESAYLDRYVLCLDERGYRVTP